jgi:hypothetical protein
VRSTWKIFHPDRFHWRIHYFRVEPGPDFPQNGKAMKFITLNFASAFFLA